MIQNFLLWKYFRQRNVSPSIAGMFLNLFQNSPFSAQKYSSHFCYKKSMTVPASNLFINNKKIFTQYGLNGQELRAIKQYIKI